MQRTAHLFPEEPGQIAGMQMHFLRQVFGGDLLVHMRIDVIQAKCNRFGTDRLIFDLLHPFCIVHARRIVQFLHQINGSCLVHLVDIEVAHPVCLFSRHSALDAETSYHCQRNNTVIPKILHQICGKSGFHGNVPVLSGL